MGERRFGCVRLGLQVSNALSHHLLASFGCLCVGLLLLDYLALPVERRRIVFGD